VTGESWIDDLVEECANDVETPTSWLWWSFLCCISAAAGNNYHLQAFSGNVIYKPNLYIMLLGESGLGKGFPINRAKILVQKAEVTRVIAGRSSIQGILRELSTTKSVPNKPLITDSRALIINGELSTAVISDPDALTILTDLYDGNYNPEWGNLLKGDGLETVKNPYITALFGSSPAHFYDSIPQANIEGGYIGRNLIIYEEKRSKDLNLLSRRINIEEDMMENKIIPKFVPYLIKIGGHKGEILYSNEAEGLFDSWRKSWRATQSKYNDKTGFINRVPDHVIKVAMCLCLARYNNTGSITELDISDAIERVTALVYSNERATQGIGLDPLAAQTKMVINYLLSADGCTLARKQLLSKGYGNYDTITLDKILETLLEMGWVKRNRNVAGKATDWIISLAGEPLEQYRRFKERRA
jgi:hypothetical protein